MAHKFHVNRKVIYNIFDLAKCNSVSSSMPCRRGISMMGYLSSAKTNLLMKQRTTQPCGLIHRHKSSETGNEDDPDKPIKYSTSEASTWRSEKHFFKQPSEDRPWYQPYVVMASLATFMLYFFVLREESDIDMKLTSETLYDYIEGLEEKQLEAVLTHFRTIGKDTLEIELRLKEIRDAKTELKENLEN